MTAMRLPFDHSARVRDGRRTSVIFVRSEEDFDVPMADESLAPAVLRCETNIDSIVMRRNGNGLVLRHLRKGRAARRSSAPFSDFLIPGVAPVSTMAGMDVVSQDRDLVLERLRRAASSSLHVMDDVYRPTAGLVALMTRHGVFWLVSLEKIRSDRSIDRRKVYDLADPAVQACPGLDVLDPSAVGGVWDRAFELCHAECDAILQGLQVDLMDAGQRLAHRWVSTLDQFRRQGADQAILLSCRDLLEAFQRKGLGRRAVRELG
jgi:hypothetical protein